MGRDGRRKWVSVRWRQEGVWTVVYYREWIKEGVRRCKSRGMGYH